MPETKCFRSDKGREQKRLYYSPSGDSLCRDTAFYHHWEYYLRGAGGEQLALYRGRQTSAPNAQYSQYGRRVYIYPVQYLTNGGELITRADGVKEISITDNLGSVRCVVGTDSAVQHFDYKPFGGKLSTSTGKEPRIGFSANERGFENRYIQFGVRTYDPEIGRFMSVDPMFEIYPDLSPYNYCNNSPLIHTDPSGMVYEKEIVDSDGTIWKLIVEYSEPTPLEPEGLYRSIKKHRVARNSFDDWMYGSSGSGGGGGNPRSSYGGGGGGAGKGYNSDGGGGFYSRNNNAAAETNGERLGSFLVSNFADFSKDIQANVNAALFTIYENGGKDVIQFLLDGGHKFNLEFRTGKEIYDIYQKKRSDYSNPSGFLVGLFVPDYPANFVGPSLYTFQLPMIFVPDEILNNIPSIFTKLTRKANDVFDWLFNNRKFNIELFDILAHEIKHFFDNLFPNKMSDKDKEESANKFMDLIIFRKRGFHFEY